MILGLRRAGITEALARFEEQSGFEKNRGVLQVSDEAASAKGVRLFTGPSQAPMTDEIIQESNVPRISRDPIFFSEA